MFSLQQVIETLIPWHPNLKVLLYLLSKQEIAVMEEELKRKTELIKKQENLIQGWRNELKDQLDKHITELDRV